MQCRRCYPTALSTTLNAGLPVSLLSVTQAMVECWIRFTGDQPRGVFVCMAESCGSSAPTGHLMMIQYPDLVPPVGPPRLSIRAALLPQQPRR